MTIFSRRSILASIIFGACVPALAAPPSLSDKLDPKVTRAIDTGLVGPPQRGPLTPGEARVLIELTAPATDRSLAALQTAGAQLGRVDGKILFYDRFVPARVDRAAAAATALLPEVARVSLAVGRGPLPLDRSAELIRLADARGARPDLDLLTGHGITIADVDTMVDPFHPTFFRGDGGYYDWLDGDGDGLFTAGRDAIDLDRNGKIGSGETALLLAALTVDEYDKTVAAARPVGFDPGIDWLYLDGNGNGRRDYGAGANFNDQTPALGEPLFVPDDVNRNGRLDPGERVVRLGTSKFKKIFVSLGAPTNAMDTYERGKNLAMTEVDYTRGQTYGFADALHATGVATILVGDVPLVGRRQVGMAPDADLVLAWDIANGLPMDGITYALAEKPDVMLFELAPWTGAPLDGSDAISQMIDTSTTQDHVTHTCPTGDEGSARKHAHVAVAPAQVAMLPFDLPPAAKGRNQPLGYVEVSFDVRGGKPNAVSISDPGGTSYVITSGGMGKLKTGAFYYSTHESSPRGTEFWDVFVYTTGTDPPLDVGTWSANVTGGSQPLTVDAYVADDQSSWAVGAAWDATIATDASTVGFPSVADHCIAVNAQPDHLATQSTPWFQVYYGVYDLPPNYVDAEGKLRAYSPLGPRIDGVQKPDVTAPDNPWVATEHDTESKWAYGSMRVFGGTSGASPHVTGVAALLAEAGIKGDAARDAIRNGAVHDATTGMVPNGSYGWGRLDAAAALGVTTVGKNFTVALTISPPMPTVVDHPTLTATAAGDPNAVAQLAAKWDDGYDGSWDTAYDAALQHGIAATTPGNYPFKVRVRNGAGHVAEAVAWVTFFPAPPPPPPSGCGCAVGARHRGSFGALALLVFLGWWVRRKRG